MSLKDQEKWNRKYRAEEYIGGREPAAWLADNAGLLAGRGTALDLAAGEGRNSVFAASLGYDVLAVDISDAALKKTRALAHEKKVRVSTQQVDLDQYRIGENAYDLILCFNFLDRRLFPGILKGLKPGGFVFHETFTVDYLKYSSFKREWVLEYNELLRAFSELRILKYQEIDREEKAFASLIGRKEVND